MALISVAQFKDICLAEHITKFIFSTADQDSSMKVSNRVISATFNSFYTSLQPNCVVFKNDCGCMKFLGIKKIIHNSEYGLCHKFTFVCGGVNGAEETKHKMIAYAV